MPNIYYPNSTVPTVGPSQAYYNAILSTTSSSGLVLVTTTINGSTAGPHGMQTGDNVEISGHSVVGVNGTWQITVGTANTFTLNGSVWGSNGGRTGNVTSITLDPAFTLPSGGDLVTSTSVAGVGQQAANALPYLFQRTGAYRLIDQYYADNTNYSPAPWVRWSGTPGNTAIADLNVAQAISQSLFATFNSGFYGLLNPPGISPYDILDIDLTTEMTATFSSSGYTVPAYAAQIGIGLETNGGSPLLVDGSNFTLVPTGSGAYSSTEYFGTVRTRNLYSPGVNSYQSFDFAVMGIIYNAGSGAPASTIKLTPSGIFSITVNHYRANTDLLL